MTSTTQIRLQVEFPSGETVTVPVDAISTPGHLKENLKYSMRIPPKLFKLVAGSTGATLDEIKPLTAEPNCLADGDVVKAVVKEGCELEAEEAAAAAREEEQRAKREERGKDAGRNWKN